MRALFLFFWMTSISLWAQADLAAQSQVRPGQLVPDKAQILITFDSALLAKGRVDWAVLSTDLRRQCALNVHSPFDEELVRQSGSALYTVQQPELASSVNFNNDIQDDYFSLILSTENRNLPSLQFSCDLQSTSNTTTRHFTLGLVQSFIGQKDFFYKPVSEPIAEPTALQTLPKPLSVETVTELNFSQLAVRERIFPKNPYFKDGQISDIGPCEIVHNDLLASDESEERTVPAGTKYTTAGLHVTEGLMTLMLQKGTTTELLIKCYYGDLDPSERTMKRMTNEVSGGFKFTEL